MKSIVHRKKDGFYDSKSSVKSGNLEGVLDTLLKPFPFHSHRIITAFTGGLCFLA